MNKKLQVIPLDVLLGNPEPQPASQQTPVVWQPVAQPVPDKIPLWVWCAGVAVVQFLLGSLMLLLAINPGSISSFLTLAGFCAMISVCVREGRAQPIVCLLTANAVCAGLWGVSSVVA
jgi:hypothetical protein